MRAKFNMDKITDFTEKAIKIHGDKYDYSQVKPFKRVRDKVEIICRKHGMFKQSVDAHLQGRGCKKCGYEKMVIKTKSNTEEFVTKAKEIFPDYDYSLVEYENSKNKIIIICPKHGQFEKRPKDIIDHCGCPNCKKKIERMSQSSFIDKANEKFNNMFDYTKVVYQNSAIIVKIVCPKHGVISMTPSNHLSSQTGCYKCGISESAKRRTKKQEKFIQEAEQKHGDKYDYSKTVYKDKRSNVIIICKISQIASNHLEGAGCKKCANVAIGNARRSDLERFIQKARQRHGDRYDYNKVVYQGYDFNIAITCRTHGDFSQNTGNHLHGEGCPDCHLAYNREPLFIERAEKLYGDKYDYSEMEYVGVKTKVKITCLVHHHSFFQSPQHHLMYEGCVKCCKMSYSKSAIQWLEFKAFQMGVEIQHAENTGEFRVPGTNFKADGFCHQTNTIFEYLGDFYHGNPRKFKEYDINPLNYKTYGELYQATMEREKAIVSLGYQVVSIWESDWKRAVKSVRKIQRRWRKHRKLHYTLK